MSSIHFNPYRRVRVWLDITKPLKRYQMIRLKMGNTVRVSLKYERLPHFCSLCGLLSHTEKDCSQVPDEDKDLGYGWGMNISASPHKGLSKLTEEVNALKLKKNLFVPKPKLFELNVANSTANRSVTHNTHGDEDVIK